MNSIQIKSSTLVKSFAFVFGIIFILSACGPEKENDATGVEEPLGPVSSQVNQPQMGSNQEEPVVTLSKKPPNEICQEIDSISASGEIIDESVDKNLMREARAIGANYIHVKYADTKGNSATFYGTAYMCTDESAK